MEEIQNKWENKEYRQQYKREYIEKNREKINAYNREYRKNNPDIYKKNMWCDCCQCLIKSGGGYQHRRTKKHQMNQELTDLKEQLNKKLN